VEKFQYYQSLLHLNDPAVILAESGMCKGGRIVNHLKYGLDDPKTKEIFA
jgi:predicted metal-dependent RNase